VSKAGFGSWDGAVQHPLRTLVLMFVIGAVGSGGISYYDGATPRSPWVSAAIGVGCGVVLVVIGARQIAARADGQPPQVVIRPYSVFSMVAGLAGAAICGWGLVVADWGLAASGLLVGALAVAMIAARWMVIRRARSAP